MAVDLSVIGRFVAGDVAIDEKSDHQQHHDGDDDSDTKTGARCARRMSAEIPLGSRQGPVTALILLLVLRAFGSRLFSPSFLGSIRILRALRSRRFHGFIECLSNIA